jgi:hypothetical protein
MPAMAVGHQGDGRPGADLAHVLVLLHGGAGLPDADLGQVGGQHVGEQPVVALDPLPGPQRVVVHVAEEGRQLGGDAGHPAVREPLQRLVEGADRTAELQDLALELVDPLCVVLLVAAEDLRLDLLNVVVDGGGHLLVGVDDPVRRGVQHAGRPVREQRGPRLRGVQVSPDCGEHVAVAVADGDHEALADEHGDLAVSITSALST